MTVAASTIDRRSFLQWCGRGALKLAVLAGVLAGLRHLRTGGEALSATRGRLGLVRPPGALGEADFLASCARCTRCQDACEAGCIELFGPAAGDLAGTPYLVPANRGCTLCLACGAACPTGALQILAAREDADMGVAEVDTRLCVSHNGTGVCGACHAACPLRNRALTQDMRNKPTVHPAHCVGCGLCEEACIVRERRAIQVVSPRRYPDAVTAGERQAA